MPSFRYRSTRVVTVKIADFPLDYGFRTKLTEGRSAVFGHTNYSGSTLAIFGATKPKPARARDLIDGTTSYYDPGVNLDEAGLVSIAPKVGVPNRSSRRGADVKATLKEVDFYGVKYVWYQPTEVEEKIGGEASGFGVTDYTGTNGVLGLNAVRGGAAGDNGAKKPQRAKKTLVGGTDGVDVVSTYIQTPFTGTVPTGWTVEG